MYMQESGLSVYVPAGRVQAVLVGVYLEALSSGRRESGRMAWTVWLYR